MKIGQPGAGCMQRVQVRGPNKRVPMASKIPVALIIRQDEDDVGARRTGGRCTGDRFGLRRVGFS